MFFTDFLQRFTACPNVWALAGALFIWTTLYRNEGCFSTNWFKISASLCSTCFALCQASAQTTLCGIGLRIQPSTSPCLKISLFSRVHSHSHTLFWCIQKKGLISWLFDCCCCCPLSGHAVPRPEDACGFNFFSWLQFFQHFQGLELVK